MLIEKFTNILRENGVKKIEGAYIIEESQNENLLHSFHITFNKGSNTSAYKQDMALCKNTANNQVCNSKSAFLVSSARDLCKGCDYLILYEKAKILHIIYIECKERDMDNDAELQILSSKLFVDYLKKLILIRSGHCREDLIKEHYYFARLLPIMPKYLTGLEEVFDKWPFTRKFKDVCQEMIPQIKVIQNSPCEGIPYKVDINKLINE